MGLLDLFPFKTSLLSDSYSISTPPPTPKPDGETVIDPVSYSSDYEAESGLVFKLGQKSQSNGSANFQATRMNLSPKATTVWSESSGM